MLAQKEGVEGGEMRSGYSLIPTKMAAVLGPSDVRIKGSNVCHFLGFPSPLQSSSPSSYEPEVK